MAAFCRVRVTDFDCGPPGMTPRRAASFFRDMNTESNSTTTEGGSVTGLTDGCPCCGYPYLTGIEPETLYLTVGCEAVAGAPLGAGMIPVHAGGRVYLMPEAKWTLFKALCASAAAMAAAMRG